MNNLLDKYYASKRKELCDYANDIMAIFSHNKFDSNENRKNDIKKVFEVYFTNYYRSKSIDTSLLEKIYPDNINSNVESKTLLLSLIDYFGEKYVKSHRDYVNYCLNIMYVSLYLEKEREKLSSISFTSIMLTKTLQMIDSNFIYTDTKNKKTEKLISKIKENVKKDNKLKTTLKAFFNDDSYNEYVLLIEKCNLYKVNYCCKIRGLESYKKKTVKKVFDKENIDLSLTSMSFDLITLTLLKSIYNNKELYFAIPMKKSYYSKKKNVNSFIKMINSKYLKEHIKVFITENDYEDNKYLKEIKENGIKLIIEVDRYEFIEQNNLDNSILLITQDFSTKYREDLDKKGIKFFVKSEEMVFTDKTLFNKVKLEIKEEE